MIALKYGSGSLALPDRLRGAEVLAGAEPPPLPEPAAAIDGALARPLGAQSLAAFVEPGDRVVIVVPDATRDAAPELAVPRILAAVARAGPSSVELRIANGTHRRATREELARLAGGARVPAGDRDCDDPSAHETLGRAEGIGAVRVDAAVARADKLVLLGAISFHYLAGFGGGGKLVAPGCADRATAVAIHRLCLAGAAPGRHPRARPGVLEGNPLQEAIGAVLRLALPAFLVQLSLRRDRRPAGVFAGGVREAHAAAAAFHAKWHARPAEPADVVIASAGGAPYDLNLYQAHKALEAACRAVRPGGTVILAAACPEGAGSDAFAAALRHATADAHEAALRGAFSIASHTALALRRKTGAARCILVSEGVDPALARGLGFADVVPTLAEACARAPAGRTLILPEGARTLPVPSGPAAA